MGRVRAGRLVGEAEFRALYDDSVEEVLRFLTPRMQKEIASHNYGWNVERTDFPVYLRASWVRYYRALVHLAGLPDATRVCDVGGFWGAFAITLKRLGFDVTMTETLKFYSNTFNGLFDFVRSQGIALVDYDPFDPHVEPPGQFDYITVMAVLEHYPHSLKTFMGNLMRMMEGEGRVYLEAPNIVFWRKRIAMLLGRSPITPLHEIFHSAVPFIGHHHEFTMRELRELSRLAGLRVVAEEYFNYSPGNEMGWRGWLSAPIRTLAFHVRPDSREVLGILCARARGTGD